MDLQQLKHDYLRARGETDGRAIPTPGVPRDTCRYCERTWRQWNGSQLDGHSKCLVPPWFKNLLRDLFRVNPALTYREVGEVLGVSISVVRSWAYPISQRVA